MAFACLYCLSCEESNSEVSTNDRGVLLRLKATEGDTYNLRYALKMKVNMDVANLDIDMTTAMDMNFAFLSIEGQEIECSTTYRRITIDGQSGSMYFFYNSDDPDTTNIMHNAYKDIIGLSTSMLINNRNGIEKAPDYSEFSNFYKTTGDLNQSYGNVFTLFPEGKVDTNDHWDIDFEINNTGINLNFICRYTLLSINDSEICIGIEGNIDSEGKILPETYQSGSITGQLILDKTTCILKNGWLNQYSEIIVQGKSTKTIMEHSFSMEKV